MSIPRSFDSRLLALHDSDGSIQFRRIETETDGDGNLGIEPDFCFMAAFSYMNVAWLPRIAFVGEKVEPVAVATKDGRRDGRSLTTQLSSAGLKPYLGSE
jgi:hypothetical protein